MALRLAGRRPPMARGMVIGMARTNSMLGGLWKASSTSANASPAYDLVVIGSGPSAIKCALDASKKCKKVAIVDRKGMMGGVCTNTGTIPSKTFREAVLHLTGYKHQGFYGRSYTKKKDLTMSDILQRVAHVINAEQEVVKNSIARNDVEFITGTASFTPEAHILKISNEGEEYTVRAEKILIAVGTVPAKREDIPFDGTHIVDSDDMLRGNILKVPKEFIVVGGGVIGMEYASMINVIPGCRSTIIDGRNELLSFADREILSTLEFYMRRQGARFLLGENVDKVERIGDRVRLTLGSGKIVNGDCLLYAVGRQASTRYLGLENVGLEPNKRGLITTNEHYQTCVDYIYAAGDCIGFPALASTSMEQGRLASCHMWGQPDGKPPAGFPYGIYTIPEISMIGKSEAELKEEKQPYEVGVASYHELAKGQMLGGMPGMLKILFDPVTLKVLGVHAIGENATEIVHIGQVVMDHGGNIRYFMENVFNYPTFAEAYRVAAFDGWKRLQFYNASPDSTAEKVA